MPDHKKPKPLSSTSAEKITPEKNTYIDQKQDHFTPRKSSKPITEIQLSSAGKKCLRRKSSVEENANKENKENIENKDKTEYRCNTNRPSFCRQSSSKIFEREALRESRRKHKLKKTKNKSNET